MCMHKPMSPHGDYDHLGEANYLIENFKIKKIIFNSNEYNINEKAIIKNIKIPYEKSNKSININNIKIYFLNSYKSHNENESSIITYFNYQNYKFLFMGDANNNSERKLLNEYNLKKIDFLKVGHHGSNTSSSSSFINVISPNYCIISVEKNNIYKHPHQETINRLSSCKVLRTDEDGTIKIKISKNKVNISNYCA